MTPCFFLSLAVSLTFLLCVRLTYFIWQSIDFFDNATTGDLIAKLNDDVRNFLSPVAYSVPRVFGAVLTLAGGLVMCLRTSWRLSLLAFTILGPLTVVTSAYSKWAAKLWSVWLSRARICVIADVRVDCVDSHSACGAFKAR